MMTNKQKQKGSRWERQLTQLLNEELIASDFKKTPSSGALGTIVGEPNLTGDVRGRIEGVPQKIKIEAKIGYGGAKQLALKKEWLDNVSGMMGIYYQEELASGKDMKPDDNTLQAGGYKE